MRMTQTNSRAQTNLLDWIIVGCEIDKTYFDLQERRFAAHAAQINLFLEGTCNDC